MLPSKKDGWRDPLIGYEYFHLELGAVSSVLIIKRGVSEHQGVKQSPQEYHSSNA